MRKPAREVDTLEYCSQLSSVSQRHAPLPSGSMPAFRGMSLAASTGHGASAMPPRRFPSDRVVLGSHRCYWQRTCRGVEGLRCT